MDIRIPHAIDEYKPSTLSKKTKNDLHNYFRGSYEYGEAVRGKANQTVQKNMIFWPRWSWPEKKARTKLPSGSARLNCCFRAKT